MSNKILQSFFGTRKRFYFGWTVYLGGAISFGFRWTFNSVADHFRFSHWDLWFKFHVLTISSVCFQANGNTEIADESWSVRGFDSRVFSTEGNIRFIPTSIPEEFLLGFGKIVGWELTRPVTSGKFFLVPVRGVIAGKEELTGIVTNRLISEESSRVIQRNLRWLSTVTRSTYRL